MPSRSYTKRKKLRRFLIRKYGLNLAENRYSSVIRDIKFKQSNAGEVVLVKQKEPAPKVYTVGNYYGL